MIVRQSIGTIPYNYWPTAARSSKLFDPELTRCSTTADNCLVADEREFEKASKFSRHEYLARVRHLNNAE